MRGKFARDFIEKRSDLLDFQNRKMLIEKKKMEIKEKLKELEKYDKN